MSPARVKHKLLMHVKMNTTKKKRKTLNCELSFMVYKDMTVTLCICAFSSCPQSFCPHSVFELLPSTKNPSLFATLTI